MRIPLDFSRIPSVMTLTFVICILTAALMGVAGSGAPALAHGYTKGSLVVDHPWGRPSPGDTKKGAVYLTIKNKGKTDDTLVSASAGVSEAVELHGTTQEDGVMKMRKMEGGIKIPGGETVKLAPGGLHIMLINVTEKVKPGEKFPLKLVFEKAGELEVSVQVEKSAPGHGH